MPLRTILLIVALVLACIAALFPTGLARINFGWLAFAFYLASILFADGWPPRAR